MTWLNWLLKLHFGLRTIPHLILTYNTQDFGQWMLISFLWLYVFKCDVYTQLLVDQTQKDFWVFYIFFKVFLCFHILSFCSNCIFHVFHQKLLQRHFCEKLVTKLFPQKWVKAKYWKHKILDRDFHDCLMTVSRVKSSREMFCASEAFFVSNLAGS